MLTAISVYIQSKRMTVKMFFNISLSI